MPPRRPEPSASCPPTRPAPTSREIAVIGAGISGLGAAWALARHDHVVVYESEPRAGGHSHTIELPAGVAGTTPVPVDTGFIVFNRTTYPNLDALFGHLGVPVAPSDMSFGVSAGGGAFEYASHPRGLVAQPRNLVRPRFVAMLAGLLRFYRQAARLDPTALEDMSLGTLLDRCGVGRAAREDHLLPMGAAIWSSPTAELLDFPARSFLAFCDNHGLLQIAGRPRWLTVRGGAREYVHRLLADRPQTLRLETPAAAIARSAEGPMVTDMNGNSRRYDAVIIATHADRALALRSNPDGEETARLGAFRYSQGETLLHSDPVLMPRRRAAWASWNVLRPEDAAKAGICVSYWMNRLQPLGPAAPPLFVTLNPPHAPDPARTHARIPRRHPIFDTAALAAQRRLHTLQGRGGIWYCGSYCGYGFHEDGLQAGLAVAEALGAPRRPWHGPGMSARIQGAVPGV